MNDSADAKGFSLANSILTVFQERKHRVLTIRYACHKVSAVASMATLATVWLALASARPCYAQTQNQPQAQLVARANEAAPPVPAGANPDTGSSAKTSPAAAPADAPIPPSVAKELEIMRLRIEQLESQLKAHPATEPASAGPGSAASAVSLPATAATKAVCSSRSCSARVT